MKSKRMVIPILCLALACGGSNTSPPPPDNQHPTAPTGLVTTQISDAHVKITWAPSTDNVGVTGYTTKAYDVNDGRYVAVIPSTGPECVDTLATPWEPMRYNVVAWDAAGNGQTSGFVTFTAVPTAADVAGTWTLATCHSNNSILGDACADAISFTINPDSTITGSMTNIHMAAPTGPNSYELTTVPAATLSGRFTGRTIHLIVEPASGAAWNLTGTTIDVVISSRPPGGRGYRLRWAEGSYSFTGSMYSSNYFTWLNMFNSGSIGLVRAK